MTVDQKRIVDKVLQQIAYEQAVQRYAATPPILRLGTPPPAPPVGPGLVPTGAVDPTAQPTVAVSIPPSKDPEQVTLGRQLGAGLQLGAGQATMSVGAALEQLGLETPGQTLRQFGEEQVRAVQEDLPAETFAGITGEDLSLGTFPGLVASQIANVGTAVTAGAASAALGSLVGSPVTGFAIGSSLALGALSGGESILEAEAIFDNWLQEMKEAGRDPATIPFVAEQLKAGATLDEALDKLRERIKTTAGIGGALAGTAGGAALNAIGSRFAGLLGKGAAKRFLARLLEASGVEAAQEGLQQLASEAPLWARVSRPIDLSSVAHAALVGGLVGSTFAAIPAANAFLQHRLQKRRAAAASAAGAAPPAAPAGPAPSSTQPPSGSAPSSSQAAAGPAPSSSQAAASPASSSSQTTAPFTIIGPAPSSSQSTVTPGVTVVPPTQSAQSSQVSQPSPPPRTASPAPAETVQAAAPPGSLPGMQTASRSQSATPTEQRVRDLQAKLDALAPQLNVWRQNVDEDTAKTLTDLDNQPALAEFDRITTPDELVQRATTWLGLHARFLDVVRNHEGSVADLAEEFGDLSDPVELDAALRQVAGRMMPVYVPEPFVQLVLHPDTKRSDLERVAKNLGKKFKAGDTRAERIASLQAERRRLIGEMIAHPDRAVAISNQLADLQSDIDDLAEKALPPALRARIGRIPALSVPPDRLRRFAAQQPAPTAPTTPAAPAAPAGQTTPSARKRAAAKTQPTQPAPTAPTTPAASTAPTAPTAPAGQTAPSTRKRAAAKTQTRTQPTQTAQPAPKHAAAKTQPAQPAQPTQKKKASARQPAQKKKKKASAKKAPSPSPPATASPQPVADTRSTEDPRQSLRAAFAKVAAERRPDLPASLKAGTGADLLAELRKAAPGKFLQLERLLALVPTVRLYRVSMANKLGLYREDTHAIYLDESVVTGNVDIEFVLMHELAHAATARLLSVKDPTELVPDTLSATEKKERVQRLKQIRMAFQLLYQKAVPSLRESFPHYLKSEAEFAAALFSDPDFATAVDQLEYRHTKGKSKLFRNTLYGFFGRIVASITGVEKESEVEKLFTSLSPELSEAAAFDAAKLSESVEKSGGNGEHAMTMAAYWSAYSRPAPSSFLDKLGRLFDRGAITINALRQLLKGMSVSQILDQFGERVVNRDLQTGHVVDRPLQRYRQLTLRRDRAAIEMLHRFTRVIDDWQRLVNENPQQGDKLHNVMLTATLWDMHPDEGWGVGRNAHLANDPSTRKQHAELVRLWNELEPDTRKVYYKVLDLMDESWDQLRQILITSRLRILGIPRRLQHYTDRDINSLIKQYPEHTESLKELLRLFAPRGPYFSLRRFGQYYVFADTEVNEAIMSADDLADLRLDPFVTIKSAKQISKNHYDVKWQMRWVESFERRADAQIRRDQLLKSGLFDHTSVRISSPEMRPFVILPRSGMLDALNDELDSVLSAQGITGPQANQLKQIFHDTLFSLFAELAPDTSIRKALARRIGVPGATKDMLRSTAAYGRSLSFSLAHMRHDRDITVVLQQVFMAANEAYRLGREEDGNVSRLIGDVLVQREIELANAARQQWAALSPLQKLRDLLPSVAFVHILSSPAWWMTNATQVVTVTLPTLASRYGVRTAWQHIADAYRIFAGSGAPLRRLAKMEAQQLVRGRRPASKSIDFLGWLQNAPGLTQDERDFLQTIGDLNQIDITLAYDVEQVITRGSIPRTKAGALVAGIHDWLMTAPHIVETLNRAVTALATYRLAKQAGKSAQDATQEALQTIADTQVDYSLANKPLLFLNPNLRPFLIFKQFAFAMYYLHFKYISDLFRGDAAKRRVAMTALAGLAVMHMIFAGAIGATFEPAWWLIQLVASALDEDAELLFRRVAVDLLGPTLGTTLLYGIPYGVAGVDTTRVNINNLMIAWQRDISLSDPDASFVTIAVHTLGVPASFAYNILRGLSIAAEGDPVRGMAEMSPRILRDFFRAYDMAAEGVLDRRGNVLVPADKMDVGDILTRALGLNPSEVSEYYKLRGAVGTETRKITDTRSRLLRDYSRAVLRGDSEEIASLVRRVAEFNAEHPRFAIRADTLRQSVKARRRAVKRRTEFGAATEFGEIIAKDIRSSFALP